MRQLRARLVACSWLGLRELILHSLLISKGIENSMIIKFTVILAASSSPPASAKKWHTNFKGISECSQLTELLFAETN